MSKSGLIFPLYFLLASGCALSENQEILVEKQEVVNAVTESQTVTESPPAIIETSPNEPPPAPKTFSVEEIRRIQSHLREAGLDPGPVDGIAGDKTRGAVLRLQFGCSRAKSMLENFTVSISANSKQAPSRQETMRLQTALRNAGFNTGPVDGILGSRTRAIVTRLQTLCPMTHEYAGLLPRENDTVKPPASLEPRTKMTKAPVQQERFNPTATSAPSPSPEEIRILQLRLRDAGFDPGPFDGVMGPQTKKALQEFQAAQRAGKIEAALAAGINVHY